MQQANELLSHEERRIIELHADHDWDEISQILGRSKEAVRKRYERAIARIREQLDESDA